MNYPINRSFFRIIQGITNTLEVFVQNVDHQISQMNVASSGKVSFTGPSATLIPSGTLLTTQDSTIFVTQADFTIGTTTSVAIIAQNTGPNNYSSDPGLILVTPIEGVYVSVIGAISGGNTGVLNFNVVNPDPYNNVVLLTRQMVLVDASRALYTVTFTPSDIIDWELGDYQYSVTVTNSDFTINILYTDLNYSPYGTLALTAGPLPQPAPPMVLDPSTWNALNYYHYSSALPGSAQLGYPQGTQTFTFYLNNFVGSVFIYGTLQQQPDVTNISEWFEVTQADYNGVSGPQQVSVTGNYLWLMIQIPDTQDDIYPNMPNVPFPITSGSISQILYKN